MYCTMEHDFESLLHERAGIKHGISMALSRCRRAFSIPRAIHSAASWFAQRRGKWPKFSQKASGASPDCEYCTGQLLPLHFRGAIRDNPADAAPNPHGIMIVSLPMITRKQKQTSLIPPWALHTMREQGISCANGAGALGSLV